MLTIKWTIDQITYLPCSATEVKKLYGLPDPTVVTEIRPHSISPGGNYIAGTCTFINGAGVNEAKGFILKLIYHPWPTPWPTPPSWQLQDDPFQAFPNGFQGVSIRGVNDSGDIVGFLAPDATKPKLNHHPFVKLAGKSAVVLPVPPPDSAGEAWSIDNHTPRNIAGFYGTVDAPTKSFTAKLKDDGSIDALNYNDTGHDGQAIKSFNASQDLLYSENGQEFFQPKGGPLHNITAVLPPGTKVTANGLNDVGLIAGFTGVSPDRKGFIGKFLNNGLLTGINDWQGPPDILNPYGIKPDIRFFSVSNQGTIVGTHGEIYPFYTQVTYILDWSDLINRFIRRIDPWGPVIGIDWLSPLLHINAPPPESSPLFRRDLDSKSRVTMAMEIHELTQRIDDKSTRSQIERLLFAYIRKEIERMEKLGKE